MIGLLALMLLQESRRAARTSPTGELILLEHQDRALWNGEQIAEGVALVEKALDSRRFGPYTLQAAIAAVHAEAESNRCDRLAADCCALQPIGANSPFASSPSESCGGHWPARWSRRLV